MPTANPSISKKEENMLTLTKPNMRKFFRTQLTALGIQTDFIEYMIGEAISAYHDVEMNRIP
jgi:hypothetical protein